MGVKYFKEFLFTVRVILTLLIINVCSLLSLSIKISKILVPIEETSCHKQLYDYGTVCELKLRTQGRGYSTTFVMSPAYFSTSDTLP
jgi:hypothetical protein